MPRIRTLKPEFWQDEKLSLLEPLTRLVFLGLISIADDAGRIVDNVKFIDGQLFPNTDDSSREPLDTLARLSRILRYRVGSGQCVIQIIGWANHQKVDHPSKYLLPGPEEAVIVQPKVRKEVAPPVVLSSRKSRESLATSSRLDLRPVPTTSTLSAVAEDEPAKGKRPHWLSASAAVYETKYGAGSFQWAMAGKQLKPIHDRGASDDQIAANLGRYLDKTEPAYLSIAKFAQTFSAWDDPGPLVDPYTGLLNERGAKLMGLA